ncbi:hypothetical protein [Holospora elegans]|uniref:hypothetical protein n=1 Tax=Holospora elegans TaxID=431043 RepID=UPI0019D324B1|nr:hypothetical protein [Holospora elegans]
MVMTCPHHGNENHLSGTSMTRMNRGHMRLTVISFKTLDRAPLKTFFYQLKDAYPKAPNILPDLGSKTL